MSALAGLVDLVLHLDRHLVELLMRYDVWIYAILFGIIFAETGFVVTPFLPGDSLLFGVGALTAVDSGGTLHLGLLYLLLAGAAVLGNSANYAIGRALGGRVFDGRYRFIGADYLRRTQNFFQRHGAAAITLSRFTPIVRTFAPFVAGVGRMPYARFQAYNVVGGAAWVALFLFSGFLFGNLPLVKNHFGLVTLLVVAASLVPLCLLVLRDRDQRRGDPTGVDGP
jgi:membrane-associated protein